MHAQPCRQATLDDIRALDASDPLRAYRAQFDLPSGVVYLDGNSLGPLPTATKARIGTLLSNEWGQGLIRSWVAHDWISAPERVGAAIARLIGAQCDEVIVADSTTVNLHKLIHAALSLRPERAVVVSERGNFPTDLYAIQGAVRARGDRYSLRLAPPAELHEAIRDDTALVLLTQVHYKSAATHDMRALTAAAQARGALVLWDLSHSAGAIEVDVNGVRADFAVGCGYKYLNGGPGAPAFLFVARRHHEHATASLSGWMGHAQPFDFADDYVPAAGIRKFLSGTPPILGIAALEVGVEMLLETGMPALVAKSRALSELFIKLVEQRCPDQGIELISPRSAAERGSHVSFRHAHGYPIVQALIECGVIGDFRAPDVMRFGLAPLYTRYLDVWNAAEELRRILVEKRWREAKYSVRGATT